ncbi:hypothetical protein ACHAXR_008838 [Thalassiosira sp. AJA248-18]
MVRYTVAASILLLASAGNATEVTVDGRGIFRDATTDGGRKLFSKIPDLVQTATSRFLQAMGLSSPHSVCIDKGFNTTIDPATRAIMETHIGMGHVIKGLELYSSDGLSIGSTTALTLEASDAAVSGATIQDGMSGDVDFPFGNIKTIATGGERNVCDENYGFKIAGPPDGVGAYLPDDHTLRVVVQSESYGPLRGRESYHFKVNDGPEITGSHIQYVDYDRKMFSTFMENDSPASDMVTGMGEMIETMINLKGEPVGMRAKHGGDPLTTFGAHYGNTDADGKYVASAEPKSADWFIQSLCSAHLEEQHQWGPGIGVEDDIFITNEEWMNYKIGENFVGIGVHALDIENKALHAVGTFTQGGFEKNVEINSMHPDYVIFAVSGYNRNINNNVKIDDKDLLPDHVTALRNANYTRDDGAPYVWPKDIVPYRIYVGLKGKLEDGSDAPQDDFLARNGLKYGQLYGFATDMSETGPTGGIWRDEWHKNATNGDEVVGKMIAQPWRWDGEVKNFEHDGSWDYQNLPPGSGEAGMENYDWWISAGKEKGGCKTEHLSPDPRDGTAGTTSFIQSSTCGYFGHLYVDGVKETLDAASSSATDGFPISFDARYFVYQGETDVTSLIQLGGKGQYTEGRDATRNWDSLDGEGKVTFEDIDGFEVVEDNGKLYGMIQEDSGNKLGERMLITSELEHEADGIELNYYFVAMSGGKSNTRMVEGVGVPKGVACHDGSTYHTDSHEFSGVYDVSGLIRKDESGAFVVSAEDTGVAKRENDRQVGINDKYIVNVLQAHSYQCGVIGAFNTDQGGQWFVYQPNIPKGKAGAPDEALFEG